MYTTIDKKGVHVFQDDGSKKQTSESEKVKFLVLKYLLGRTGKYRLGFAWILLEPILISLVYVFLFSVIRSGISGEIIILGIGTYSIFSSSIRSGMSGITDTNGGFTAERVSTSTLIKSKIIYSAIEGSLQAISILFLLFTTMDIDFPYALLFIPICALTSVLSNLIGFNLVLLMAKTPDVKHVFDFVLRLGFFVSPVLYPIESTTGLHRQFTEYNPISYVIDASRFFCGAIEAFDPPTNPVQLVLISLLLLICIRGAKKVETYRWEISTWN